MKELSIEEKAKAYDEALERAKKVFNCDATDREPGTSISEYIFPALKESEDERIKNALIQALSINYDGCTSVNGIEVKDIVAWLKKQGTSAKLSEEEQNRFAKGVLTSCALSFINYLDAHKYEGKMCVSNGECEDIENAFHNALWDRLHRYYCKYIEKQGEQKPNFCHHEVDFSDCSEEYRKAYYDGWDNCNQQHSQLEADINAIKRDKVKNLEELIGMLVQDIVASEKDAANFGDDKKPTRYFIEKYLPKFEHLFKLTEWKPSKEQLKALRQAQRYYQSGNLKYTGDILESLYNDLKAL